MSFKEQTNELFFFVLFFLSSRERRLCCSMRKLSTQLNYILLTAQVGDLVLDLASWSPWRDGATEELPMVRAPDKKLSDERKPPSISVKRIRVWMWRSPVLELRSASPVGSDCQIRSQKFPSDVCWGKRSLCWECELSPASPTAGSVCYGDEEEGRK